MRSRSSWMRRSAGQSIVGLLGAIGTVARVAEAWRDVGVFIQPFVDRAALTGRRIDMQEPYRCLAGPSRDFVGTRAIGHLKQ
jgi:hypothetical protein